MAVLAETPMSPETLSPPLRITSPPALPTFIEVAPTAPRVTAPVWLLSCSSSPVVIELMVMPWSVLVPALPVMSIEPPWATMLPTPMLPPVSVSCTDPRLAVTVLASRSPLLAVSVTPLPPVTLYRLRLPPLTLALPPADRLLAPPLALIRPPALKLSAPEAAMLLL